jgi:hypothetical protein
MGLTGLGVPYETDVPDTGERNGIKPGVVPDKFHEKQNYIHLCRPMKHRAVQSNTFWTALKRHIQPEHYAKCPVNLLELYNQYFIHIEKNLIKNPGASS